jgi:hypothetical protein
MTNNVPSAQEHAVLGQKYAFAAASLVMGVLCYVNAFGLEKAAAAVAFAWLALKARPVPPLRVRRAWAKAGMTLGLVLFVIVPTVLILNFDRVRAVIEALKALQNAR